MIGDITVDDIITRSRPPCSSDSPICPRDCSSLHMQERGAVRILDDDHVDMLMLVFTAAAPGARRIDIL
jgi:hypothetical protein